ncbi:NAD-dependent epimerase/dehydratase family protein [Pararhodonellum marinum]|uniref:NAD-dependent epimerase/dehydratase family protein n=1 Tax=Pararhodonellum marinum TaxID=2755358 RepID=UPI00188F084F|nr:NAD-dependent epimerase/dehydratase family protein [Pararhodonellum marinum]
MNLLITGITGLFGSYLYRAFSDQGIIHGLKRQSSSLSLLGEDAGKITWHEGDINDPLSLEAAFSGMDLIIHAAGLVSFDPRDNQRLWTVNQEGTKNVVDTMLFLKIPKLIHISSVAALGRIAAMNQVNENQKWAESELNTAYATSKYHGELEVWRGAQEGLEVMVFNPSVILGKVKENRSSSAIYQYVIKEHRYFPSGKINYIDARDAASMVKKLFLKNQWGERFILSKEGLSYREFFKEMAAVFQKKPPQKPVPTRWIWLGLLLANIRNWFAAEKTILNKQTALLAQQDIVFDSSKSTSLTGQEYYTLQETFLWARNEN